MNALQHVPRGRSPEWNPIGQLVLRFTPDDRPTRRKAIGDVGTLGATRPPREHVVAERKHQQPRVHCGNAHDAVAIQPTLLVGQYVKATQVKKEIERTGHARAVEVGHIAAYERDIDPAICSPATGDAQRALD